MSFPAATLPRRASTGSRPVPKRLACTATLITALLSAAASFAQSDYPSRPLRFLLGFPPGGTSDMVARAMGELLSESLGQPVVMDNRPGAAGKIKGDGRFLGISGT